MTRNGVLYSLCTVLILTASLADAGLFHYIDFNPPEVETTDPVHLESNVFPMRHIHFWLVDQGQNSSGVDTSSITLSLNEYITPVTTITSGNGRVWVHTSVIQHFPENSVIEAVINACDNAGNCLVPYRFHFYTSAFPDGQPPLFTNLYPPDQSTDIMPFPLISCVVKDTNSGINLNSVVVLINGNDAIYTYADVENGYQLFFLPSHPFPYETWVSVYVSAEDNHGNKAEVEWSFRTATAPPYPPKLFYPQHQALLNYQKENGLVRFIWSADEQNQSFRIRIRPEGSLVTDVIDLAPSNYWFISNMVGFNLSVDHTKWYLFSCRKYIEWSVALIDKKNGSEISEYSNWSSIVFAPPDAVVLRSPANAHAFSYFDQSPLFTWDSFNNAQSYYFGIARMNFSTGSLENVYTQQMSPAFNNFRLPEESWRAIGTGWFIWAVIAVNFDGTHSDFMNYTFTKTVPQINVPPLIFY